MRADYEYRFGRDGAIHCNAEEGWKPTATMSLDGVQRTSSLGPSRPCERDFLRVMAAVLAADRLSPRRPPKGTRPQRDLAWQRSLSLEIAVECPERWTAVTPLLTQLLSFMTDDAWKLRFKGIAASPVQQQLLGLERVEKIDEVALFSGGLDSVAGLFARSKRDGRSVLAVSACGNEVRGGAQKAALEMLRSVGAVATWLKLDHQLRGVERPRSLMEPSQRSRGLLFLAMGATTAYQLQLPSFSIYETGVGCINLPISSAQVGAQATRAMHPRTLLLFNELTARVLDGQVRVEAPFFLHTKGELCSLAGAALGGLARVSMSCDEGEGHKPDTMLHCGLCTSCVFRRIALHAGGLHPDPTRYRDVATRQHGVYEVNSFESHALRLRECRDFEGLLDLDPDARFAATLPLIEPPKAAARIEVFAMYQRYADEIQAYLAAARPTVRERVREHRKVGNRALFPAVG